MLCFYPYLKFVTHEPFISWIERGNSRVDGQALATHKVVLILIYMS
jgi:hypothetical protein